MRDTYNEWKVSSVPVTSTFVETFSPQPPHSTDTPAFLRVSTDWLDLSWGLVKSATSVHPFHPTVPFIEAVLSLPTTKGSLWMEEADLSFTCLLWMEPGDGKPDIAGTFDKCYDRSGCSYNPHSTGRSQPWGYPVRAENWRFQQT